MITIYHLGVSQSDRIVWLMEELGLPYELEWFDRNEEGIAPDEYMALHPAATAPMIKDGDLILPESTAVVEYISQKYGDGKLSVSVDSPQYANYLYWLQFNNNLQGSFFAKMLAGEAVDTSGIMFKVLQRREDSYFTFMEQTLENQDYLAGKFSCADIMTLFNLTVISGYMQKSFSDTPNTAAYIERVTNRPAYIKAMSIAGPNATKPQ